MDYMDIGGIETYLIRLGEVWERAELPDDNQILMMMEAFRQQNMSGAYKYIRTNDHSSNDTENPQSLDFNN